ncbi:MAG: MBL fold metallo-hydrolase [Verrucomicrobia bacterium]|nr:MAG: MBL fold metallo-hydrolase [Verrucomicrobiota bacterium]
MQIRNLNPSQDIGASAWYVQIDGHRLLMDAGTHPKLEGHASMPLYEEIKNEDVDAIAISHCHHDHVGSLPMAQRYFPKAHVLMTELSYFLVERVLHNSVNVMMRQKEELGIQEYPLFTHDEIDETAHLFQGFRYNREVEWAAFSKTRAGFASPTLEFYDAGHALGSAGIMVRGSKETLFYTGDVCFRDQTLLKAARFTDVRADVLIMETTRGNRMTPVGFTREAEVDRLAKAIQSVIQRRGCILIPVFALGRTQEILAQLALMMRSGQVQNQPIYIGGLGRVFTEIYDLQAHRANRNHTGLKLTDALNLIVLEKGQSEKMRLNTPRIFVVTAGMMSEKTAAHDLAMRMAGDPKHAIFFVGYADPDTAGGRLKAAKHGETFLFSPSGGELTKQCQIEDFDLTAHANREDLLDFVGQVNPRTVLLGHGSEESRMWFEKAILERHPKIKIVQPQPGVLVEA